MQLRPQDKRFLPDTITVFNPSSDKKTFYPCVIKYVNAKVRRGHRNALTGLQSDYKFNVVYDFVSSESDKTFIPIAEYTRLSDAEKQDAHFTLSPNMTLVVGEYPGGAVDIAELTDDNFRSLGLTRLTTEYADEPIKVNGRYVGIIQFGK